MPFVGGHVSSQINPPPIKAVDRTPRDNVYEGQATFGVTAWAESGIERLFKKSERQDSDHDQATTCE